MSVDELEMQATTGPAPVQQDGGDAWIDARLAAGAKFVVYQWNISLIFVSFKHRSGVKVIMPGQSRLTPGLKYSLLALVAGPWGIPFGIFWTIQSIIKNCQGGIDITPTIVARRQSAVAAAAGRPGPAQAPTGFQSL